jgi:hypothetical protein
MRYPKCTAVPMATRSAQVPTGYAAFSMFAPVRTWEDGYEVDEGFGAGDVLDGSRRDAPTRKRE